MRTLLPIALVVSVLVLVVAPPQAEASRYVRFGVQDDAWLLHGPGSLEERLDVLDRLGVDLVRYTIRWDEVARRMPRNGAAHGDAAYDWSRPDAILQGLRARGIAPLVTLYGTPRWANGGRTPNWAPRNGAHFGKFAYAAQKRYPWVRDWLVWNEPNQRRWLRPTSPAVYVSRLLNPAYSWIKRARRTAKVGGGVTAPRGAIGGVSPVAWIRGMDRAGARLDAYAHHPYPLRPRVETPWTGGCGHCETITMATLERLVREVRSAFGNKRIWLTEYGYQTRPHDRSVLAVSQRQQARYLSEAALRVYQAPFVDILVKYMVVDDGNVRLGWQSGLFTKTGAAKPSARAFPLPIAQVSRRGVRTVVWGQLRPGKGRQLYRLQQWRNGKWHWVGGNRRTNGRGFYQRVLRASAGSRVRIFSFADKTYSPIVDIR